MKREKGKSKHSNGEKVKRQLVEFGSALGEGVSV